MLLGNWVTVYAYPSVSLWVCAQPWGPMSGWCVHFLVQVVCLLSISVQARGCVCAYVHVVQEDWSGQWRGKLADWWPHGGQAWVGLWGSTYWFSGLPGSRLQGPAFGFAPGGGR